MRLSGEEKRGRVKGNRCRRGGNGCSVGGDVVELCERMVMDYKGK